MSKWSHIVKKKLEEKHQLDGEEACAPVQTSRFSLQSTALSAFDQNCRRRKTWETLALGFWPLNTIGHCIDRPRVNHAYLIVFKISLHIWRICASFGNDAWILRKKWHRHNSIQLQNIKNVATFSKFHHCLFLKGRYKVPKFPILSFHVKI